MCSCYKMPEDYPWVRSKTIIVVVFALNIRLSQITITISQNEYKVAQEPVLVQQYLCTRVKFLAQTSVLFCCVISDGSKISVFT